MGDFDHSLSLSSLLCHENESCFFNDSISDHDHIKHDRSCFSLETEVDVEYVEKLVERETITFGYRCHASFDDCLITSHNWLKFARLDAIEWILNVIRFLIFRFLLFRFSVLFLFLKVCVVFCFQTRAIYGFRFHTAYLSVTYFDRFVSKRSIDVRNLFLFFFKIRNY